MSKPNWKEELKAELNARLDKIMEEIAEERGITKEEVLKHAIDFLEKGANLPEAAK